MTTSKNSKTGYSKLVTLFKSAARRGSKTISIAQMADYSGLSEKSVHMHISWNKLGTTRKGRLNFDRHSSFVSNYLAA